MSNPNQRTVHVALVGLTGVGKSTLVNVLTHGTQGRQIARVNNDVKPCTHRAEVYVVSEGGIEYRIWDTRGLNEAREGLLTRILKLLKIIPDAEAELIKILRDEQVGISLVLLCVDRKKSRARNSWNIYNAMQADFCQGRQKVAVLLTQMERTEYEGYEWRQKCKEVARGVVEKLPDDKLMEAVPVFSHPPDEEEVMESKNRILTLISNACPSRRERPFENSVARRNNDR